MKIFPLLISVFLMLLSILDFRRGFLFSALSYTHRTPFYAFSYWQIVLFLSGVLILFIYKKMKISIVTNPFFLISGLFVLLVIDLFTYRGVAASRVLTSLKINTDWLNGFDTTGYIKPLGLISSYLLTVWHATFISCLLAGLGSLILPTLLEKVKSKYSRSKSVIYGTILSLTQPLCSCCAAISADSLFKFKNLTGFGASFLLGAPLLNISTLVLAYVLLPDAFFIVRLVGGLFLTLSIGFILSKLNDSQTINQNKSLQSNLVLSTNPIVIIKLWLKLSLQAAKLLIPGMILGTLLASVIWSYWPNSIENNLTSVFLVSLIGSFLMISTWTEIPIALMLINNGLPGPAAAALIALPAINAATLWLLARRSQSWTTSLTMLASVFIFSFVSGLFFLK